MAKYRSTCAKGAEAGPHGGAASCYRGPPEGSARQVEIDSGAINRAGIARRERITRARVTRVMYLLGLPEELKAKLLSHDPDLCG